jgi:hypothetical protein
VISTSWSGQPLLATRSRGVCQWLDSNVLPEIHTDPRTVVSYILLSSELDSSDDQDSGHDPAVNEEDLF